MCSGKGAPGKRSLPGTSPARRPASWKRPRATASSMVAARAPPRAGRRLRASPISSHTGDQGGQLSRADTTRLSLGQDSGNIVGRIHALFSFEQMRLQRRNPTGVRNSPAFPVCLAQGGLDLGVHGWLPVPDGDGDLSAARHPLPERNSLVRICGQGPGRGAVRGQADAVPVLTPLRWRGGGSSPTGTGRGLAGTGRASWRSSASASRRAAAGRTRPRSACGGGRRR